MRLFTGPLTPDTGPWSAPHISPGNLNLGQGICAGWENGLPRTYATVLGIDLLIVGP